MAGTGKDVSTCTTCGGLLYWNFDHWVHIDTESLDCPDYEYDSTVPTPDEPELKRGELAY